MPPAAETTFWTDECINATINRKFIIDKLEPNEQILVNRSPAFESGLTDSTYLDWILTRAKRFFLILVEIKVPDQIFGIVDESWEDIDLPLAADAVHTLRLSCDPDKSLDKRFWKAQFRYLVKDIDAGEHVRFGVEEIVPVEPVSARNAVSLLNKDDTDKVILPGKVSRVYSRRKIDLHEEQDGLRESDVLDEVATLIKYSHEHIISIFASYAQGDNVYVLLSPAPDYTVKSFLNDTPRQFESVPKFARREILINWPHCLASALAWLHSKRRYHGALRPSNIYVDSDFRIFLGQLDAFSILHSNARLNDIEVYNYAAPERWKRVATAQATAFPKTLGNSGGQNARQSPHSRKTSDASNDRRSSWSSESVTHGILALDTSLPTNTAVPFISSSKSRIKLRNYRPMTAESTRSIGRDNDLPTMLSESSGGKHSLMNAKPLSKPSASGLRSGKSSSSGAADSSNTSRSSKQASQKRIRDPIAVPAPELRTAIVQTWQSDDHDLFAADIFTLGAICLDILSFLCKRSLSTFARHRAVKNRPSGRGVADASFHANIEQLHVWCKWLDEVARKKAKKDDGNVFGAVKPMLEVVLECIEKDPDSRISARDAEIRLAESIWKHTSVGCLHCRNTAIQTGNPESRASDSSAGVLISGSQEPLARIQSSHSDNDGNQRRGIATAEQESAATGRKPKRDKLGLPAEPPITNSKIGNPLNSATPNGYMSLPTNSASPRPGQEKDISSGKGHSGGESHYLIESLHEEGVPYHGVYARNSSREGAPRPLRDGDEDDDHEMLESTGIKQAPSQHNSFLLPDSRPTSLAPVSSGEPPILSLNRFSRFRIDLRYYSNDAESLRTVDTLQPGSPTAIDGLADPETELPLQLNSQLDPPTQRSPVQSMTPGNTKSDKLSPESGGSSQVAQRSNRISSHASIPASNIGPATRRQSTKSISSVASRDSTRFSWGWTNTNSRSRSSNAKRSRTESYRARRVGDRPHKPFPNKAKIVSGTSYADNRTSQTFSESHSDENRRGWPLTTTAEIDESVLHDEIPPPSLPLRSPLRGVSPSLLPLRIQSPLQIQHHDPPQRRKQESIDPDIDTGDTGESRDTGLSSVMMSPTSRKSNSTDSGSSADSRSQNSISAGEPKSFYRQSSSSVGSTSSSSSPPRDSLINQQRHRDRPPLPPPSIPLPARPSQPPNAYSGTSISSLTMPSSSHLQPLPRQQLQHSHTQPQPLTRPHEERSPIDPLKIDAKFKELARLKAEHTKRRPLQQQTTETHMPSTKALSYVPGQKKLPFDDREIDDLVRAEKMIGGGGRWRRGDGGRYYWDAGV